MMRYIVPPYSPSTSPRSSFASSQVTWPLLPHSSGTEVGVEERTGEGAKLALPVQRTRHPSCTPEFSTASSASPTLTADLHRGAGVGLHSCPTHLPSVCQASEPGRLCPGFRLSRPTPSPTFLKRSTAELAGVSVHPRVLQAQRATFEHIGSKPQAGSARTHAYRKVHTALTYQDPRHTLYFRTYTRTLRRPPSLTATDAPSPAVP